MDRQRFKSVRIATSFLIFGLFSFIIYSFNYKYKETIFLQGRVTSSNQSSLINSPIIGKISKIYVTNNQTVRSGDLLASFDCKKIVSDLKKLQYDSDALAQYILINEKEIKSQKKLTKLTVESLSDISETYKKLASSGAVSELQARDYAVRVKSATIEGEQRISSLTKRSLELKQSMNSLDDEIKDAEISVNDCNIKSPHAGIVSEIPIRPGQLIGKGSKMFRLFLPSKSKLSFVLPSQFVSNVKLGSNFEVRVPSYPFQKYGSMSATVEAISPVTGDMIEDNGNVLNIQQSNVIDKSGFLLDAEITKSLSKPSNNQLPKLKNGMPVVALFQSTDKKLIYILSDQFVKLQNSIQAMRSRF